MEFEQAMNESVLKFYEDFAGEYHLIFADWRKEVLRQGKVLDNLIRDQLGETARTVLDCTCGIGTQAIGLASCGYGVHATDLSPTSIERARQEAQSFGVTLQFEVADLRVLDRHVTDLFDVVLSCDNALPHFLNNEDLSLAVDQMLVRLRTGGLLMASIRDYDLAVQERKRPLAMTAPLPGQQASPDNSRPTLPRVFDDDDGRRIVFQVWDWSNDGRFYTLNHFIMKQRASEWKTTHLVTQYRALQRHELSEILRAAGFSEIHWHMPAESGFYQPLVTARKI